MIAFHCNWTKPFFAKHTGEYYIEDFEILTTILSALKWRQLNGSIKMITDKVGAQYYKSLGIEPLWNLGLEVILDDVIDPHIDPYTYWAAGKLYALQSQKEPCVMIDTDFIVWHEMESILEKYDVAAIHEEALDEKVYPPQNVFHMKEDYIWPENLDWSVRPHNTALLSVQDMDFKNYYTNTAIDFMKGTQGRDHLIYMVFAEQRLVSMCARHQKKEMHSISNLEALFSKEQNLFTHVWGYKKHLILNKQERTKFCRRCIRRIIRDYPYMEYILERMEPFKQYFY